MGSPGSLRTRAAAVAVAGALTLDAGGFGCSSSDDSATGGGKKDGKVVITMGMYGVMGIKETGLLEQYEKENPDVEIKAEITAGDEQTYYTALQTRLAAGKGLKDIQGIEIGRAKEITETQSDKFVDFSDVPGTDHFLPWKDFQISTEDGKVLGLGTDIGPMAVCYRKDYFEQAGLPTEPRRRSPSCGRATGRSTSRSAAPSRRASRATTCPTWTRPAACSNAMVYRYPEQYYDDKGELIYDKNPVVEEAWNLATDAADDGLTAKLPPVPAGLGPGPGQRHVRHRRVPRVDAQPHQREGR
ncbi:ABC transporter substrate-binding protein [Streptomyces hirsutus]